MNRKTLYLLSPTLPWKTFKMLHDKFVHDSGPTPSQIDKVLWQMLRDKQILLGFRTDMPGDMWIGRELPKRIEIKTLMPVPKAPQGKRHKQHLT